MKPCEICSPGTHMIRTAGDLEAAHPAPLPTKVVEAIATEFPEAAKWSSVCDSGANMVVQDFLEWLGQQDIRLARYDRETYSEAVLFEVRERHDDLVYSFFEVDPGKLETDRREMLKLARRMA